MSSPSTNVSPAAAWARVRIHLNLHQLPDATREATAAAAVTVWGDPIQLGGPWIFGLDDLPVGWAFFDPDANLAVLNAQVRADYGMSPQLFAFMNTDVEHACFLPYDVGAWKSLDDMDEDDWNRTS